MFMCTHTMTYYLTLDTFDDVHVQTALDTRYSLYRITADGRRVLVTNSGIIAANTGNNSSHMRLFAFHGLTLLWSFI